MEKTWVLSSKKNEQIIVSLDLRLQTPIPVPQQFSLPPTSLMIDLITKLSNQYHIDFLDTSGQVKPHFLLLINSRQIELLNGVKTELSDGDTVAILSAVHGGR